MISQCCSNVFLCIYVRFRFSHAYITIFTSCNVFVEHAMYLWHHQQSIVMTLMISQCCSNVFLCIYVRFRFSHAYITIFTSCNVFVEHAMYLWHHQQSIVMTLMISQCCSNVFLCIYVRFRFSHAYITIFASCNVFVEHAMYLWHHQQSIVMSSTVCKANQWDKGLMNEYCHFCHHSYIHYFM